MPAKPKCSNATFSEIARLNKINSELAKRYERSLTCSTSKENAKAYIDKNGNLNPFGSGYKVDNNITGTCPSNISAITAAEWNKLPIGQTMTKNRFCGLATIDEADKQELVMLGNKLIDTATSIYTKIKNLEKEQKLYLKRHGEESEKLGKTLQSYKYFYDELSQLSESSTSTLGGQLADAKLVRTSSYYKFILWGCLAAILLIHTTNYVRRMRK